MFPYIFYLISLIIIIHNLYNNTVLFHLGKTVLFMIKHFFILIIIQILTKAVKNLINYNVSLCYTIIFICISYMSYYFPVHLFSF